ncbi:DUF2631 domain-containing protein [Pseudonocardia sp. TRM90224]|uniref:DUF2631 domain-containing protein n=1 Tax=Pseudonocardia sp. TRM90224 TaxID=2812678 RepID=UPI001E40B1E2|nr:DUF2631 domain-containing protein [Pseudonocardia sp. TRM90224]
MARNSRELAKRPTVDPHDEPSAEWGWHGGFPRGMMIAGWISVIALLFMQIGNHQGRTENLWLVGIAVIMAIGLINVSLRKRNAWRR